MRSRSSVVLCLLLAVTPTVELAGQTALADQILAAAPATGLRAALTGSPGNPWYTAGFQVGYELAGNSSFSDDIVASARTTMSFLTNFFHQRGKALQLPVVGNLGKLTAALPAGRQDLEKKATELLNSADGITVEFAPYWLLPRSNSAVISLTLFGSAGLKVNAAKNPLDSSTVYLHQRRFAAGVEVYYKPVTAPRPLTLSVGPTFTTFNRQKYLLATGKDKSNTTSLDVTLILPTGGFGLLAQGAFAAHTRTLWRVGVLVAKQQ